MPLGASLTDGFNVPGGYRIELEDKLVASGVPFDFVGSLSNGPASLADKNHEGHSGYRIDQIHASVTGWFDTFQPDVVLLLVGTNDVLQDFQLATAPDRLAALIDRMHELRPTSKVFVSSLPPLTNATDNAQAQHYNAQIPGIVDARAASGRPVWFVDAAAGLTTADLADGVHLTASGYAKLATIWYQRVAPVLGVPSVTLTSPSSGATFASGEDVALAASASDPEGALARVEFYAGASKLGEDSTAPYEWTWVDPPSGSHSLSARAVDGSGAAGTSASVSITVAAPPPPPPGSDPVFYRAVNLGGGALTIDGRTWEAGTSANVTAGPKTFQNQSITLNPATDTARATMIRSAAWGAALTEVALLAVPAGSYDVYVTVWEDNWSSTYDIRLEGTVVQTGYRSGSTGSWARLGPFRTTINDSTINLSAGPDANLSGIEAWRVSSTPSPPNAPPTATLTSPSSGATFASGEDVALAASASDPEGALARVEFYAGASKLGEDSTAPYEWTWVDPPSGTHSLSARAVDGSGAAGTSASVSITVAAPPPPPPGSDPVFYRAVNLGGGALTIDGRTWEAGTSANVTAGPKTFQNQSITLNPATDTARATMIRSAAWGAALTEVALLAVPAGSYDVYVTVWEDNWSSTYDIRLEGTVVQTGYRSGSTGSWARLGPFRTTINDSTINLSAGPDANLSGIEAWRVSSTPSPPNAPPTATLTSPSSGATFASGEDVALAASASDPEGALARVEFYAGASKLGEDSTAPYEWTWVDPPSGSHSLSARAVDGSGAAGTSASVSITVAAPPPPPPGSDPVFYRAVNLGGGALTIDGRTWEAGTSANVTAGPKTFQNQSITLNPATDTARATMIRSAAWGAALTEVALLAVPAGSYDVYVTVWEDNWSSTYDIRLEGTVVQTGYRSGSTGSWARLGPFRTTINDSTINLSAGPDANLSGIEAWRVP